MWFQFKRNSGVCQWYRGIGSSEWEKFCMKMASGYLHAFHGSGRIFRGVDQKILKGKFLKKIYTKRRLCSLRDYTACDAQLDVIRTFLKKMYKE